MIEKSHDHNEPEFSFSNTVYTTRPTSADADEARRAFAYRTFFCPCCRTKFSVTKLDVGKTLECPDCGTKVVVPNSLDFDTESDYEHLYLNREKQERDKLLSPIRNPNREGLTLEQDHVYALRDLQGEANKEDKHETYYPVHCRVCETLIQVPSYMLGKTVICPDCGTETVVTDSLKKQWEAAKVRFEPTDRGVYGLGEIPDEPIVAYQLSNGKTILIDPKDKSVAPNRNVGKHAREQKKSVAVRGSSLDVYRDASLSNEKSDDNSSNGLALTRIQRLQRNEREKKGNFILDFLKKKEEKRRKRLDAEEDLAQFLPPMVLRRKNGELVWALPSPPKRLPLFNKTFRVVKSEEIWTRGALIAIACAGVGYWLYDWVLLGSRDSVGGIAGLGQFMALLAWSVTCPLVIIFSSMLGLFFWSVYNAGNCGAKRVVEWRNEDLLGFFGYGLWFLGMLVASLAPGRVVASLLSEPTLLTKSLLYSGSFWLFFPIFWLATMQSGFWFWPITTNILTSFVIKPHIWLQFYLTVALYFFVPCVGWGICAGSVLFWIIAPVLTTIIPIFFGLLLGRLSWILDDVVRTMDFDA